MTRDINIRPVLNGFICQVGCQTVVFDSNEQLLTQLRNYLTDPQKIEQWFLDNSINKDIAKQATAIAPYPTNIGETIRPAGVR